MKTELIQEYVDSRGVRLQVDEQAGIIHGVKVLGMQSSNGRSYPKQTIAEALSMYDGAKVNVNHPAGDPTAPRSYQDRLGTIRNPALREGDAGLYGDLYFNPRHPVAAQLIWDATNAPENVGLSHNVEAKLSRKNGYSVVEEITRVRSVDLVADPATTRGLYESHRNNQEESDMVDEKKPAENVVTLESLMADHPSIVETIKTAAVKEYCESQESQDKEKASAAQIAKLTEELAAERAKSEAAERLAAIDKMLTEAKFSDRIATAEFVEHLRGGSVEDAKRIIETTQRVVEAAGGKPTSREQRDGDSGKIDRKAFLKELRG